MEPMRIVGKTKVGSQRRITITGLFQEQVEKVILAVDIETEMVEVIPYDETTNNFGTVHKIGNKNRLILPVWVMEELGDCKELFFVIYDNRAFLSPKTGDIL